MNTPKDNLVLPKAQSWQMFNDISPRYDFLNHFLSFGLDIHWRNKLVTLTSPKPNTQLLDLATGTGDVILAFLKRGSIASAIGVDLAQKMLDIGETKIKREGFGNKVKLIHADISTLPLENNYFDLATMAFGIRNTVDPKQVLREINRVLKKEGSTFILEFSLPENPIIRFLHLVYLRHAVPLIAFLFSGHYRAYRYLNQTIETFPYGAEFEKLLKESHFTNIKRYPLLFGVATIYEAQKPSL